MKKQLGAALLALVLGLTACGPAESQPESGTEPSVSTTSGVSDTTAGAVVDPSEATGGETETTTGGSQGEATGSVTGAQTTAGTTGGSGTTSTTKTPASTTTQAKEEEDTMLTAMQKFLQTTPAVKELPDYAPDSDPNSSANEWSNIKAITYDGASIGRNKTKVFAYVGFPEGASASNKVPAVVLVHGGGGHAFAQWVKLWTDRGYAAIAMDNTGFFPSESGKGKAGWEADSASMWHFGLYGDFAQTGYANAPNNDEMKYSLKSLDEQWMYHAVASVMLARKVLAADSRVDASKIGVTGISWGGVITSLTLGYDPNFAFAIPVYGSGYLDESHGWMGPIFSGKATKELWSAAERFDNIKIPTLWLAWSNDVPFSINSNSKSYLDTKSQGSILSLQYHWGHSHGQGWKPQEAFAFADSVVKGGPTMTTVVTEPKGRNVSFTIKPASDATAVKARILYITEKLSYTSKTPGSHATIAQSWKSVDCTVNGNTVTGTLPSLAHSYYVEITTTTPTGKYITTTQFVEGR